MLFDNAKLACKNSNIKVNDHFANVGKMVDIGSNAKRITKDFRLTRYACYLIAQNGDSNMITTALAKITCHESRYNIDDHFALRRKMIDLANRRFTYP